MPLWMKLHLHGSAVMSPADVAAGVPCIVTRGDSTYNIRKGDRVEWESPLSAYTKGLILTRGKIQSRRWFASCVGDWQVEYDREAIAVRVAKMRADADALESLIA